MSDIVERLRRPVFDSEEWYSALGAAFKMRDAGHRDSCARDLMDSYVDEAATERTEAADEIERLQGEAARLTDERERGTAALRTAFGPELWQLGHPAYVVVHLREEIEKVTRLWKAATVERDALRASLASAEAEVARLTVEAARHETEMGEVIDERDEMESALSAAHVALGGDGEWACRVPSPPPPDSGHLCLDVPALAERVATENAALLARVEAAEKDAARYRWLTSDHDDPWVRQHCREILERMGVMSYSATSTAIDTALEIEQFHAIDAAMEGGK